jgi:hypothetical protein
MAVPCRRLLLAAVFVAVGAAPAAAVAQPPAALPPAPAGGPPPPMLGPPQPVAPAPPPPVPAAPPPPAAPPLFAPCDPGADGWFDCSLEDRLFFEAELQFLAPAVKNRLRGTVVFPNGATDNLAVPAADLEFTVAPRLAVGYRLPDSAGEFVFSYRFLATDGRGTAVTPEGELFDLRSRLDFNQFDFDYASVRYSPLPLFDLKWWVGARLATAFFDSRVQNDFAEQQAGNYFVGAGPHAGLEVERRFGLFPYGNLAAFAGLDGAVLLGQVRQHFHETFFFPEGDFRGDFAQQKTQSVPVLTLRAGLRYTPPRLEYVHFSTGYQFERWWNLGKIGNSAGELTDQGVFFRAEFDY